MGEAWVPYLMSFLPGVIDPLFRCMPTDLIMHVRVHGDQHGLSVDCSILTCHFPNHGQY